MSPCLCCITMYNGENSATSSYHIAICSDRLFMVLRVGEFLAVSFFYRIVNCECVVVYLRLAKCVVLILAQY
jgi:hypothetical protein